MKLMEILEEVQNLESQNGEFLSEAKKRARKSMKNKIKKKYNAKKARALKIAKKLKARRNNINWTDDVIETRNEIVAAFMANDSDKVLKMMSAPDGYKAVEILKALETAHGGYKKLESKAKDNKNFVKTVYAYIDDLEAEENN